MLRHLRPSVAWPWRGLEVAAAHPGTRPVSPQIRTKPQSCRPIGTGSSYWGQGRRTPGGSAPGDGLASATTRGREMLRRGPYTRSSDSASWIAKNMTSTSMQPSSPVNRALLEGGVHDDFDVDFRPRRGVWEALPHHTHHLPPGLRRVRIDRGERQQSWLRHQ